MTKENPTDAELETMYEGVGVFKDVPEDRKLILSAISTIMADLRGRPELARMLGELRSDFANATNIQKMVKRPSKNKKLVDFNYNIDDVEIFNKIFENVKKQTLNPIKDGDNVSDLKNLVKESLLKGIPHEKLQSPLFRIKNFMKHFMKDAINTSYFCSSKNKNNQKLR